MKLRNCTPDPVNKLPSKFRSHQGGSRTSFKIIDKIHYRYIDAAAGTDKFASIVVVIANDEGNPSTRCSPMYDDNQCLICGLPIEPVEWIEDLSGIGDDFTNLVSFQDDDELCCCAVEDEDD